MGYFEHTGFGLYVNAAGEVAFSKLVTIVGKDYLIDKNGGMVTYRETISAGSKGYYTLNGTRYVIHTDNTAEEEEKFYINGEVQFEDWPEGYDYRNIPATLGASVEVYFENGSSKTVDLPVTVSSSPAKITASTTEFTLTAKADLSKYYTNKKFEEKASYKETTEEFIFKDGKAELADIKYIYKKPKFVWPKSFTKDDNPPSVTVTYTVYSMEQGKALDPITQVVTSSVYSSDSSTGKTKFRAAIDLSKYYTDPTGETHVSPYAYDSYKTYKMDSSGGGSRQSDSAAIEDGEEKVWNLFYKRDSSFIIDTEGANPLDDPAKYGGSERWMKYYDIEVSGDKVYVDIKDDLTIEKLKTAANKDNSTIRIPLMDDDGVNVIGELKYPLPVVYYTPVLSLSSKEGTIYEYGGEQVLKTFVSIRKSTGVYEPLDITDQQDGIGYFGATSGSGEYESQAGDLTGEIDITASQKGRGYINIMLENWNGTVSLPYNIKASKQKVISAERDGKPCKQIILNNRIGKYVGADQRVDILVNGSTDYLEDVEVSVIEPNNYRAKGGFTVEGIENGVLTDSTLTISYPDDPSIMTAGTYTFQFKTPDKGSFKFKVIVSKLDYEKIISLKTKTKYDIVSGQKMVIVPTLKGMDGIISDVILTDINELFEASYDEESNQIIIEPVDDDAAADIAVKGSGYIHDVTLAIYVDGVVCKQNIKFRVSKQLPRVRVEQVTIPRSSVLSDEGKAISNLYSTFNKNKTKISIKPKYIIYKNSDNQADADGFVYDRKRCCYVRYNEDSDNFTIIATPQTTEGAISMELYYAYKTKIDKSISIKIDKKN
ncbi:MAG: hypothetical protein K5931_08465 [Lachnospiraceae bacterium]|nr:hypothetical protein [Lachnospiraceae bacterium]